MARSFVGLREAANRDANGCSSTAASQLVAFRCRARLGFAAALPPPAGGFRRTGPVSSKSAPVRRQTALRAGTDVAHQLPRSAGHRRVRSLDQASPVATTPTDGQLRSSLLRDDAPTRSVHAPSRLQPGQLRRVQLRRPGCKRAAFTRNAAEALLRTLVGVPPRRTGLLTPGYGGSQTRAFRNDSGAMPADY